MNSKKAEMGIGTLILFIAMILVAAVAAGVLIQTASSLQAKALLTGSKSTSEVSTAIQVTYVYGKNASSSDHSLDHTFMKAKLVPGSDPIKFSDMVINVDARTSRQSYVFNTSIDCTSLSNMSSASVGYGVNFLSGTATVSDDYLYRGDIVELCFKNPTAMTEGMDMKITIVPKAGQQASVQVRAPDVLVQDTVPLYP